VEEIVSLAMEAASDEALASAVPRAGKKKSAKKAGGRQLPPPRMTAPSEETKAEQPSEGLNPRKQEDREKLDELVLGLVAEGGSEGIRMGTLRKELNMDAVPIRASLGRLIEAEKVTWTGERRSTTYFLKD
jgi:hypothetical protein